MQRRSLPVWWPGHMGVPEGMAAFELEAHFADMSRRLRNPAAQAVAQRPSANQTVANLVVSAVIGAAGQPEEEVRRLAAVALQSANATAFQMPQDSSVPSRHVEMLYIAGRRCLSHHRGAFPLRL